MSRRGSTAFVPKPFVRSFSSVHCIKCRKQFPTRWFRDALLSDELDVLRCSQLQTRFANAQTIDNKPEHFDKTSSSASFSHQSQTTGEEEALHKHTDVVKTEPWWKSKDWTASTCDGLVKPDVTFFGEKLPRRFWEVTIELKCLILRCFCSNAVVKCFYLLSHICIHFYFYDLLYIVLLRWLHVIWQKPICLLFWGRHSKSILLLKWLIWCLLIVRDCLLIEKQPGWKVTTGLDSSSSKYLKTTS